MRNSALSQRRGPKKGSLRRLERSAQHAYLSSLWSRPLTEIAPSAGKGRLTQNMTVGDLFREIAGFRGTSLAASARKVLAGRRPSDNLADMESMLPSDRALLYADGLAEALEEALPALRAVCTIEDPVSWREVATRAGLAVVAAVLGLSTGVPQRMLDKYTDDILSDVQFSLRESGVRPETLESEVTFDIYNPGPRTAYSISAYINRRVSQFDWPRAELLRVEGDSCHQVGQSAFCGEMKAGERQQVVLTYRSGPEPTRVQAWVEATPSKNLPALSLHWVPWAEHPAA